MTGNDFLKLASNLAVNPGLGDVAPRCRTAVSRTCYAAFHFAVEFLAEFGVRIPANHTGHQEASRQLHKTKQSDAQMAARLLEDLRTDRNEADYRLDRQRLENQRSAMDAVESASQLRQFLEACRQEPARSEIVEALSAL